MAGPGRRATRRRSVLLAAVVAAALAPALGSPALAQYPDVCWPGVEGLESRALVALPADDAPFLAAARRLGARVGARIEPLGIREVLLPSPDLVPALAGLPGVRHVEREVAFHADRTVNDQYARAQWGLNKIRAQQAWDASTGGGVTVAVIDTGVDLEHPDLRGRVIAGPDVLAGDDDPSDDIGHGTHVAGTIAATANNRIGVAGVAYGAKVLAVKVLGAEGFGNTCHVIVGVLESVQRGASVINMSIGVAIPCPVLLEATFDYADNEGVLPVASAGNDGITGSPSQAPANCPHVLGVAATNDKDRTAIFSSFGEWADVSAPGADILSTTFDPETGEHGYGSMSGTSMASPHVAALAALLRSKNPSWTPAQVSERIIATSDDIGPKGRDDFYGAGRINAGRALGR